MTWRDALPSLRTAAFVPLSVRSLAGFSCKHAHLTGPCPRTKVAQIWWGLYGNKVIFLLFFSLRKMNVLVMIVYTFAVRLLLFQKKGGNLLAPILSFQARFSTTLICYGLVCCSVLCTILRVKVKFTFFVTMRVNAKYYCLILATKMYTYCTYFDGNELRNIQNRP